MRENGTLAQRLAQMQDQMVKMAAVIEMQSGGKLQGSGGLTRSVAGAFAPEAERTKKKDPLSGPAQSLPTAAAARAMQNTSL